MHGNYLERWGTIHGCLCSAMSRKDFLTMSDIKQSPSAQYANWPLWSLGLLLVGLAASYIPTYVMLAQTAWSEDENGHGPMILALSLWLLWGERHRFFALKSDPAPISGLLILGTGVLMYIVGRSQKIDSLEAFSQILALSASVLLLRGWPGLRLVWFPLFFLLFMVPVPGVLAQALTLPLKSAVSYCAEWILHTAGYPIGRSGVTLVVGPYQLLVADACSGLNSIFTLEALGLFYMKLMDYKSKARNIFLAIMILPISFISNTIRVIVLVLVTYHLGDEIGQGFVHSMAGLVLFSVAMVLIYALDRLLVPIFDNVKRQPAA